MVKVIPEKTVELWTAFALVDQLGPDTWIWSRTKYVDQDAWTPDLRKWFVLELKAPEGDPSPYFKIDIEQLRNYELGFSQGDHPDVLYVLPDYPWRSVPTAATRPPSLAAPSVRRSFAGWAYVIRASALLGFINPKDGAKSAKVVCGANVLTRGRRSIVMPSLHSVLAQISHCTEAPGMALRSAETFAAELEATAVDDQPIAYERWSLTRDRIAGSIGSLESTQSDNRLFVGWA